MMNMIGKRGSVLIVSIIILLFISSIIGVQGQDSPPSGRLVISYSSSDNHWHLSGELDGQPASISGADQAGFDAAMENIATDEHGDPQRDRTIENIDGQWVVFNRAHQETPLPLNRVGGDIYHGRIK